MDLDCESEIMKSDEEITRGDKPSGTSGSNHNHYTKNKGGEQRRMVDITRDKPIKVAVRVVVPVRDHPKFNFVGKLLGPKGNSLKRLQEDTMCKMAVLGRGSMKDRHKEEELRASGDPKFQHLSEELHVEISAFATPAEAHARIAYALAEVRRFLVPDYNDDIRQEQMWEMQVLSSQRGNGSKNEDGNGEASSIVDYSTVGTDDRLSSADIMEGGPESPPQTGEHPALRGIQPVITALSASGNPESQSSTIQMPVTSLPPNAHPNANPVGGGSIINCTTPNINNNNNNNNINNNSSNNSSGANSAVGGQLSPGTNTTAALVVGANAGRKRPLLAAGPRTSMTPTKRTVMSLLARARAAQAKQLPATFQRGTPERSTTLVPLLREDYITGAVNLNLI